MNDHSPDLGNLSNLKLGDSVVTVFVEPQHGLRVGHLRAVLAIEPKCIRIRHVGSTRAGVDAGSFDPETGRTLLKGCKPTLHLSANPAHIAIAKKRAAGEAARLETARSILRELVEEAACDEIEALSGLLARRLDPAQLSTLGAWLKQK